MTNTTATDRLSYDDWKALQVLAYEAAGNTNWMSSTKALRMARRHSTPPRDAFTGPFWAVKPWLTQEAIDWFEVAGNPRYTFTDWERMERERRAKAAEYDASQNDPLEMLEYIREIESRKAAVIVEARAAGASWADIMRATGLSRMTCNTLAKSHLYPAADEIAESAPAMSADDVAMLEHAQSHGFATWAEFEASHAATRDLPAAAVEYSDEVAF